MGYLFLAIALFSGATKGYCGKKMGNFASNVKSAVLLNLIRMALCVVFGSLFVVMYNHASFLSLEPKLLIISAVSGISTSVFVVTWLLSVRKSAYMMLDVFLMLGTLIPMMAGYFAFGESIRLNQWIGFVILTVAVVIMCSYNNTIKTSIDKSSFLLLVVCGFANGLTDFSQKLFVKKLPDIPISVFNLYTYSFAAVTLAVIYLAITNESVRLNEGSCSKYIYVVIMAAALFANSYFKTKAADYLDSATLYPLNQGLALILSTLMASLFFKEKLTAKGVIGIATAFTGLLIINML